MNYLYPQKNKIKPMKNFIENNNNNDDDFEILEPPNKKQHLDETNYLVRNFINTIPFSTNYFFYR